MSAQQQLVAFRGPPTGSPPRGIGGDPAAATTNALDMQRVAARPFSDIELYRASPWTGGEPGAAPPIPAARPLTPIPAYTQNAPDLLGRELEAAQLDATLSAIRTGAGRTLVLRGEAGVGKSAVLDHAVSGADDVLVVRTEAVESETTLPFANLHQLCTPLAAHLVGLPLHQREPLEMVLAGNSSTVHNPFLIGLAVLSLLCEAAESCPLVCVIDNAHWLDDASAQALAFVGRRLRAEAIGLIFATRVEREELRGFPEMAIEGLRGEDARALLRATLGRPMDRAVCERIIAEANGNPSTLLELSRGLTSTRFAGGFGLLTGETTSGLTESHIEEHLRTLPNDARQLLLLAAAEPVGDSLLLWRAAD
ncbi:MAG: AAA family ATPase, partial [Solirubrobacteraceae bacterium]